MRALLSSIVTIAVAAALAVPAVVATENTRPIIGILTQPHGTERNTSNKGAYIAASYVKAVEMAGARVVPVFHTDSHEKLNETFHAINGLLLPGGGSNISTGSVLHSTGKYLYDLALAANDKGDVFPVWGTCMGFQFLTVLTANDDSVLCTDCFTTEGFSMALNFTAKAPSSRLLNTLVTVQPALYHTAATQPLTANSHHDGILASMYATNAKLKSFYDVLSVNTDPHNGKVFASTMEAKHYPIMATQWHPEKSNFEWRAGRAVNHSLAAVRLSQYVADTFVSFARASSHKYPTESTEQAALIYNYAPEKDPLGYFEQIYAWS